MVKVDPEGTPPIRDVIVEVTDGNPEYTGPKLPLTVRLDGHSVSVSLLNEQGHTMADAYIEFYGGKLVATLFANGSEEPTSGEVLTEEPLAVQEVHHDVDGVPVATIPVFSKVAPDDTSIPLLFLADGVIDATPWFWAAGDEEIVKLEVPEAGVPGKRLMIPDLLPVEVAHIFVDRVKAREWVKKHRPWLVVPW